MSADSHFDTSAASVAESSADVSAAVAIETAETTTPVRGSIEDRVNRSIEDRVNRSLAVSRYIRAKQRFEEACSEFNDVCLDIRKCVQPNDRFIVKHDWSHYLVTTDADGNFEVEQVDLI